MATIKTIQSSDLITNSRADINDNFSALNAEKIETSTLDTDTTLAANSDSKIATQKAVKAYVDSGGNQNAGDAQRGIVELATDAEIVAGTDTGSTGANLAVIPSRLNTQIDAKIAANPTSKKVNVDTTEITFENSSTETDLFDVSVPANTLGTNNAIRVKIWCSDVDVTNSYQLTIKLKYGATTVATAVNAGGNGQSSNYNGWIEAYLVADGATGAQKGAVSYLFNESAHEINGDATVNIGKLMAAGGGAATEDSTGDLTLAVSADWNAASTNSRITAEFWVVDVIS